jgi:hypothetical protein
VALLGATLVACAGWKQPIPFALTDDVLGVLSDWRKVGLSCPEPQLGWPGPAVDWYCRVPFADPALGARLIADRYGVQSIVAGVPAGTSALDATRVFVALVRATSLVRSAEPEIERWLLANNSAEGTMSMTATTQLGHATVALEDGSPVLYLVPFGSSIMVEQ